MKNKTTCFSNRHSQNRLERIIRIVTALARLILLIVLVVSRCKGEPI